MRRHVISLILSCGVLAAQQATQQAVDTRWFRAATIASYTDHDYINGPWVTFDTNRILFMSGTTNNEVFVVGLEGNTTVMITAVDAQYLKAQGVFSAPKWFATSKVAMYTAASNYFSASAVLDATRVKYIAETMGGIAFIVGLEGNSSVAISAADGVLLQKQLGMLP